MYFSSSKDILFIVLAFSVLWLAIFLSWALYYLIGILKDARDTVNGVKKAADAIENAASHIKDRMGAFMNIASIGVDGIKMFMERAGEKKNKKK